MPQLYRRTSGRPHLLKQGRRSPVVVAFLVVIQPLFLWAWYRHPSTLRSAVSHLHVRSARSFAAGGAGGAATAGDDRFSPPAFPLPVHHTAALLDYSNHPVAPSRPPATQFRLSPTLYAQATPAVAVVTATRDARADWLRQTAQSLFGQSLQSLVWLIVDDASTDPEAVDALRQLAKDPRVVVLRNDEGLGVGRSRNRALEYVAAMAEDTRPRYVVSLEDDDLLELTALEKVRLA